MRLFLDAEFVAPNFHLLPHLGLRAMQGAMLLSLALVADDGDEFYLEVEDQRAVEQASDFVTTIVLPQLGLVPAVKAKSLAEAGDALADFLERKPGVLLLTADFGGDVNLLVDALRAAGRLAALEPRLRLDNASWTAKPGNEGIWASVFERHEDETGLCRHHALLDARALRDVFTQLYDPSRART